MCVCVCVLVNARACVCVCVRVEVTNVWCDFLMFIFKCKYVTLEHRVSFASVCMCVACTRVYGRAYARAYEYQILDYVNLFRFLLFLMKVTDVRS